MLATIRGNPSLVVYGAIMLLAAVVRFAFVGITPWDWDESLYTAIARHVTQLGYPAIILDPREAPVPFLFQPPFHSYLLSGWHSLVGDSIYAGRLLSSLIGVGAVGLCMVLVERITNSYRVAALAGVFVALDGWSTYSGILVKLDVATLLVGMVGLLIYTKALRENSLRFALLAGIAVGAAVIYKHTGIVIAGAIVINWLLFVRGQHQLHYKVLGAALVVVVAYIGIMYAIWGQAYLDESFSQVRRIFGFRESPGLNYGVKEVLNALFNQYWIFAGSILAILGGGVITLIRTWQMLFKGREGTPTLLLAWAIASGAILSLVPLHNTHHVVLLIVPLYCVIAYELTGLLGGAGKVRARNAALLAVAGILALSVATLGLRVVTMSDGNALRDVQTYVAQNIPEDQSILTEQTICMLVKNPCYQLGMIRSQKALVRAKPEYLIVYTTTTFPVRETAAFKAAIQGAVLEATIKGWKEEIEIYKLKKELFSRK